MVGCMICMYWIWREVMVLLLVVVVGAESGWKRGSRVPKLGKRVKREREKEERGEMR